MQRGPSLPDESLAQEVLPPILVALGVLASFGFGLLMLYQYRAGLWPYLLATALVGCVWAGSELLRFGRLRAAGSLVAYALALIPIGTIFAFGVAGNSLLYLPVLGVLAAGLLISPAAPLHVASVADRKSVV